MRRRARSRTENGFTLVELLAVVVLLGVLASLMVGVVGPLASAQRAVLAESTLREALRRSRTVAMVQGGCELRLGDQLSIQPTRADDLALRPINLLGGWWATLATNWDTDDASPGAIEFGPDGVATDARLALVGARGDRIELALHGLSGAVHRVEDSP